MNRTALVSIAALVLIASPLIALADGPVVTGASDITIEATGPIGTAVNFDPTASDSEDGTDPVVCTPASGTVFDFGTTTVSCTASDSLFATTTATFDVGVVALPTPVPIHLEIDTATTTIFDGNVDVSECSPSAGSPVTVNGFCAFAAAGIPVATTQFSFGIDIDSIGGINDPNSYWLWFLNGDAAQVGIDSYQLSPNDTVLWTIGIEPLRVSVSTTSPEVNGTTTITVLGFNANNYDFEPVAGATINGVGTTTDTNGNADILATSTDPFSISVSATGFLPSNPLTITPFVLPGSSVPVQSSGGGGGGGGGVSHTQFNIQNALAYLTSKQNTDGSFGSSLITDWTALAFAATGPGTASQSLKNYELTSAPALSSAADYERHAMALEALGINPYSGTPVNYIAPIVADFDGTQIGDPSEDNDDIFAIFPLLYAGYTANDSLMQKEAAFILSKQRSDGSWDESPDLTAAAVQALGPLYTIPGLNAALGQAVGYLISKEQSNGSWGTGGSTNIDSTSWVQTAINGIIAANTPGFSTESTWASPSGYYPTDALAQAQQSDGAVQASSDPADTRTWSTAYAVVAASGQSWDSILKSFSFPATTNGAGGGAALVSTSTLATSTILTSATTTPAVATSTLPTIATSTPLSFVESTTTATTTPRIIPKPKKTAIHHTLVATTTSPIASLTRSVPPTTAQAAAAAGSGNGFAGTIWHALTSFFSWLL